MQYPWTASDATQWKPDRRDDERYSGVDTYDAHKFYTDCMGYGKIADGITRAMDSGEEEDVAEALCNYIDDQDYNPEIKDYVRSRKWITPIRNVEKVATIDQVIDWMYKFDAAGRKFKNNPCWNWPMLAVNRYISTGRSWYGFNTALCKANPEKLTAYIFKSRDLSDDGIILACKRYLHRYCGYKEA